MQRSRLFILDDTPAAYRPIVQVIDNFARNHKLGRRVRGARRHAASCWCAASTCRQ